MPNPSPLASATPEQLEAWASLVAEIELRGPENGLMPPYLLPLRAAADLLRAVAKAQRTTDLDVTKAGCSVFVNLPEFAVWDRKHDTLPAALAALLEEPTR